MITVSLCMIVKNEGKILDRCLKSLEGLMDEIIIVDTGSTDNTKEIAKKYTDKIYDFQWTDDFSAARNFSFSKAQMDYIYAPDADEVLDDENRAKFKDLKEILLPEIEIVQMKYNTVNYDTVLNVKKEYRPKLFKRVRNFEWTDPIHETVRTFPVVYDSEIEILHMPENYHHKRDFGIFLKAWEREGNLSDKIEKMYAKELLKCGELEDFENAYKIFDEIIYKKSIDGKQDKEGICVLSRYYLMKNDNYNFMKTALKEMASEASAEICYDLGEFYKRAEDYDEAIIWYYNAYHETESILDIHTSGDLPLKGLVECYDRLIDKLSMAGQALREGKFVAENENMKKDNIKNTEGIMNQYIEVRDQYKELLDCYEIPEE